MISHRLSRVFLLLTSTLLLSSSCFAQSKNYKRHMNVTLRMIGHSVLLSTGDSTSRVLPIKRIRDQYLIQFEKPFKLQPSKLVSLVDSISRMSKMAKRYLVEVEKADSKEIVHAFEKGFADTSSVIPCGARDYPIDGYQLLITILEPEGDEHFRTSTLPKADTVLLSDLYEVDTKGRNTGLLPTDPNLPFNSNELIFIAIILFFIIAGIGLWVYFLRKKKEFPSDENIIHIGSFQFDQRNMKLVLEKQEIELTGKEADLLLLLHNSTNKTIERDEILRVVWGDEGDYIGRTLDVFISKLRKKLEADNKIKIANIRGVGYKLVVNH
jgi:hypothetical protein